jgi:hypothetical protein
MLTLLMCKLRLSHFAMYTHMLIIDESKALFSSIGPYQVRQESVTGLIGQVPTFTS